MEHTDQDRYSRQIRFAPIGREGQEKLQKARIAIVGMGALGTASASQLARAGIGYLRIIDRDIIEQSNLQRQSLYDEADAANTRPKATAAADKLRDTNSSITIEPIVADLTARNAADLLTDVDLIIDGSDNLQVRYLINDVSVKYSIPWIYAGAVSSYGTTTLFRPGETPCLVCAFGPYEGGGHDTCDTVGVISPIVTLMASLQVAEALKWLTGNHEALRPGFLYADLWTNEMRTIRYGTPNPDCPCCNAREFVHLSARADALTVSLCGRRTIQIRPLHPLTIPLQQLAARLAHIGNVRYNEQLLRLDLGEQQLSVFADGRALIHGVDEPAQARALYARYIGE